jgi:hypothetical protein
MMRSPASKYNGVHEFLRSLVLALLNLAEGKEVQG